MDVAVRVFGMRLQRLSNIVTGHGMGDQNFIIWRLLRYIVLGSHPQIRTGPRGGLWPVLLVFLSLKYAFSIGNINKLLIGYVRSTARHAIHLQFDISANSLEIRAVQIIKCLVWLAVDCTILIGRANGNSFVCDVNGFSFVKNSNKYYDDCAKILGNMILRELAPTLHIPWSVPFQLDDPPIGMSLILYANAQFRIFRNKMSRVVSGTK
jgi:hypothetical protein